MSIKNTKNLLVLDKTFYMFVTGFFTSQNYIRLFKPLFALLSTDLNNQTYFCRHTVSNKHNTDVKTCVLAR